MNIYRGIILSIIVCQANFIHSTESNAESSNYPKVWCPANKITVQFVKDTQPKVYAEFGIAYGNTAFEVAKVLPQNGTIYLFDYYDKVESIKQQLHDRGFNNVFGFGNSYKLRDSYNWSLMTLMKNHLQPLFDYVFLDGMHTWDIDGFAFLLIDKMLKPGGYIDFDDYNWTLNNSPTLSPSVFPLTKQLYTDEQINTSQVKLIVDLLVKDSGNYTEIVKNKIFQKNR